MEDIEKVLRNLEDNNKDAFLNTDKGKAVLNSIALVKKITKEVAYKGGLTCEHDIEDICAFFEGNLSDNENATVEEQIFSCDSCFSVYSLLQNQLEEIQNHTPEWLKEQVIEKIVNANSDELEKKSIFASLFYKFKDNFGIMTSGLTVAAIAILYINLPLQEKEANMELAKVPEQVAGSMKQKESADKIASVGKDDKKQADQIIPPKPDVQDLEPQVKNNEDKFAAETRINAMGKTEIAAGITSTKSAGSEITNKQEKLSLPSEKKPATSFFRHEIKPEMPAKTTIIAKRPDIVNSELSKPATGSTSPVTTTSSQPNTDETVMIANAPLSEARLKESAKEEEQMESKSEINSNNNIAARKILRDGEKNIETDKDAVKLSQAEPEKFKPGANETNAKAKTAAPTMDSLDDIYAKKNTTPADAGATVLKKERAADAKAKGFTSSEYSVTVNSAEFEKSGFIVIHKDLDGKRGQIIGNSKLFSPGKYYNIKVQINKENAGKRVQAVIYEDSNNSTLFDSSDKPFIKNNSPVTKVIDVN